MLEAVQSSSFARKKSALHRNGIKLVHIPIKNLRSKHFFPKQHSPTAHDHESRSYTTFIAILQTWRNEIGCFKRQSVHVEKKITKIPEMIRCYLYVSVSLASMSFLNHLIEVNRLLRISLRGGGDKGDSSRGTPYRLSNSKRRAW